MKGEKSPLFASVTNLIRVLIGLTDGSITAFQMLIRNNEKLVKQVQVTNEAQTYEGGASLRRMLNAMLATNDGVCIHAKRCPQ